MTYEKVTVHSKTGEFIATFNDVFRSLADVRHKVSTRCQYTGTVEVSAYSENGVCKSFNMRLKP